LQGLFILRTIMETQFYILMCLKTTKGFVNYGQHFLGNDRKTADELFRQLKGNRQIDETSPLHIDLMETVNELPVKINSLCCTLEELGFNCKLITREIFRLRNLEDMDIVE
jgi:hypothetical protein